jgi:hypothetical protein
MGISATSARHPQRPPRGSATAGWLTIVLTIASLTSLALTALLGLGVAWLAIALGAALLSLVLLMLPG